MFGLTSFVTSGVLIAGLLALRYFELSRGSRLLPKARVVLDDWAIYFVEHFIKGLPHFVIRTFKYVILQITHVFSATLLHVVRFLEEKLHIAVHKVRGKKNDLVKSEPTSNHLADMKNHKEAVSKTIEELEEVS